MEGNDPTEKLTTERGTNYGHPVEQFQCVELMYEIWLRRYVAAAPEVPTWIDRCLRHTVYMILTKLSRCAADPLHMDSYADIKGYAHCFEMCEAENRPPMIKVPETIHCPLCHDDYLEGALHECEGGSS